VGAGVLLSGCEVFSSPQNTLAPDGDVAETQKNLFFLVMWPALAILILTQGIVVYIALRYRQKRKDDPMPAQVHGNPRLEVAWTIAPTILLAIVAIPTLGALFDISREPRDEALRVDVEGQRFSWTFTYPTILDDEGDPLVVRGVPGEDAVLRIPIEQEVGLYLTSVDVIHSFWVPKLAGKLDVVPGRENRMWLKAERPGTYSGQCAEFCGTGHAEMRMSIISLTEEDFQAWLAEEGATQQTAPPAE
jgi:cytochrome c oxidase subunit 2